MAHISSPMAVHSQTSEVESTQHIPFGSVRRDEITGNVYIYVDFQEALAQGEWVVLNNNQASGLTTTSHGQVGVVHGTVSASDRFGWVQVYGTCDFALGSSSISTDLALILQAPSTDISCPTVATTSLSVETLIHGATAITAASTATTTVVPASFTVSLNFPFVYGTQTS